MGMEQILMICFQLPHIGKDFCQMLFYIPNAPNPCQVNPAGFEWFDLMQTNNDKITQESLISLEKYSRNN